jgi:anti-sigma regulatory factor (Ser/Thr protein kinase)
MAGVFTPDQLASVRTRVSRYVAEAGLTEDSGTDFVIAVNEAMTNVVRHGGGVGTLHLWRDGSLVCDVRDHGAGFETGQYTGRTAPPPASESGGMGLWLVQQLSGDAEIRSGPGGTSLRITAALPG